MNTAMNSNCEMAQFAYGMKNGKIVRVDEVEKGLACGCECIGCG